MKLLIVDDNEKMRRVIKGVLGDQTDVVECDDGRKALAAFERSQPDWVIMDIKMKELNGIAATREIIAAFPAARIVIVTNYDDAELREAARQAGACAYVLKEDLLMLQRLMGQGSG